MIRVRDNKTKRFKEMFPHPHPYANVPDKRHCYRSGKVKPEEKLEAVQRIRNGETKAGVARSINVPESTLRGWCKSANKIQIAVDRALSDGSNSPTLPDNLKKSQKIRDWLQHGVQFNSSVNLPTSMNLTQSKSPSNASQHYRPWTPIGHDSANMNASAAYHHYGINQFGSKIPNPRYSPSTLPPTYSPMSVSRVVTPKVKEDQLLRLPAKTKKCVVNRQGVDSATPNANSVALDLRLPTDLSIRPIDAACPAGTMSANFNNSSNNNNDCNNNITAISGDDKNRDIIHPFDAFRYAQIFYNWFQTYSDPTLTTQDFLRFQDLLRRVQAITQRREQSSVRQSD